VLEGLIRKVETDFPTRSCSTKETKVPSIELEAIAL
jgi:hypothetical protein